MTMVRGMVLENGRVQMETVTRGSGQTTKKEGLGKYTEAEGHCYVGAFSQDKREGQCIFTYFDGSKYEGSYLNDKKHGLGTFSYSDGQKYEGSWFRGKRHGIGSFTYADGCVYEGQWVDHKRHGRGNMTDRRGVTRASVWRADEQLGEFRLWLETLSESIGASCCSAPEADSTYGTGDRPFFVGLRADQRVRIDEIKPIENT